jgi:hypothetical protein
MTHPAYEQLVEARTNAQTELSAVGGALKGLVTQLRHGVSYEEAVEIVNRFWEPREAMVLKTKLYNNFPKENGRIILEKGLDDRVRATITTVITQAFFVKASEDLQCQIRAVLDHVNGLPVQSTPELVTTINTVRMQVAKFLGYMGWGVYEIRSQLLSNGAAKWEDLSPTVDIVEQGDYLFLENLEQLVGEALKTFVDKEMPVRWEMSLGSVEYRLNTIEAVMELILLFANYLHHYPLGE